MVKKRGEGEVLRCSFCNKHQDDVRKLIAGPRVFICDECVHVCTEIIADDYRFSQTETSSPPARVEFGTMAALMDHVAEISSSDQWLLVMHLLARLRGRELSVSANRT